MISHSSILMAQSGPISKSLVALSAHAAAALLFDISNPAIIPNKIQFQNQTLKLQDSYHKFKFKKAETDSHRFDWNLKTLQILKIPKSWWIRTSRNDDMIQKKINPDEICDQIEEQSKPKWKQDQIWKLEEKERGSRNCLLVNENDVINIRRPKIC